MKKSEVLRVLGSYVVNYYVENFLENKWFVTEVHALTAYHMAMLDKYILSIEPTNKKSMLVHFCSTIEID